MMRMSVDAMEYRNRSPASAPSRGDGCHIGSDRKRSEAVEQTLLNVGVQSHSGVDGDEDDGLHQYAGQQVLDVLPG